MPRLTEDQRESLVVATVDVVMEARRMALMQGASPLKLWDQLTSRLRAAARSSERAESWASKFIRDLQINAPSKDLSLAIQALAATVGPGASAWLDLIDREYGYVIARARIEAERRKAARDPSVAAGHGCNARHPEIDRECHRTPHGKDQNHETTIEGVFIHWGD